MSKRTYGQYCGLAAALDAVGQRWALLIVRDLVPGPRRFTDLFEGLPGISSDLLTDRLRSLEAAGAVQQRTLKTPVPANLYELTDRGRELAKLAGGLARWGAPLLQDIDDPGDPVGDYIVNARWVLQYFAGRYRGGFPDGDVHLTLDDSEELTLSMLDDNATLAYGHSGNEPLLRIESTSEVLLGLLRSPPEADTALPDEFPMEFPAEFNVGGDEELVASFLRSLSPEA